MVISALVTRATEAVPDGTVVADGFALSSDLGAYLMIGVDDPDLAEATTAAHAEQEWASANYTARDESGDVTLVAWCSDGADDQQSARNKVFAIADAIEGMCRADPTLGVTELLWSGFGKTVTLRQGNDALGATALLIFTIHFRARL